MSMRIILVVGGTVPRQGVGIMGIERKVESDDFDDEGFLKPGWDWSQSRSGYIECVECEFGCDHCGAVVECELVADPDDDGHHEWRCAECAS